MKLDFDPRKNITTFDNIAMPLKTQMKKACSLIDNLLVVHSIVKNWQDVSLFRMGIKKVGFVMELRNGKNIRINKPEDYFSFWDGSQARDFINVNDVANITLMLLEKGSSGVYNVGTGNAFSYEHIAEVIDKSSIKHVDNPLKAYQYLTKADTSKLLRDIGDYKFMNLDEWIAKTI